jgi:hypothetical protein
LAIRSESICHSPEELLKSRKFAQFLCFFNKAKKKKINDDNYNRKMAEQIITQKTNLIKAIEEVNQNDSHLPEHQAVLEEQQQRLQELGDYEQLECVTPEQVAQSSELAEEVYQFFLNSDIEIQGNELDIRNFNELLEKTLKYIRKEYAEVLADNELVDTPDWVIEAYPVCDEKLPARIVRDMELFYQDGWLTVLENVSVQELSKKEIAERLIGDMMNNFAANYILERDSKAKELSSILGKTTSDEALGQKIGRENYNKKRSDLMNSQTYREFFAEIDRAMDEANISAEEARQMDFEDVHLYLFPAFLELLKRGYKIYPDLSI